MYCAVALEADRYTVIICAIYMVPLDTGLHPWVNVEGANGSVNCRASCLQLSEILDVGVQ